MSRAKLELENLELREALRKCCLTVSPQSEISDRCTHGLHCLVPAEVQIGVTRLREQLAEANHKLDHLQGAVESALADGRWSEWSRFGSRAEAVRHDRECALEESR